MSDNILTLQGVSKYYTGGASVVVGLNNVNLRFDRGEFVAVTGESGSGKSTLAQVISGILPYESGEIYVSGRPTSHFDSGDWERYRRDSISFISQSYGILPGSTVFSNVVSALRITGMDRREAAGKAEALLKLVELWELRSRRAAKLSSGQKQRLSIARALAKPAPILVADEPTGNLDPENSARVIRLLAQAAKDRLVILITHDFQEAEGFATRRIRLLDGRVILDTPLAPAAEPAPAEKRKERKNRFLSPYISRLQMGGRPVWSVLTLLFFTLTAFAVFAFLGSFIVNLDDTSTRIYDTSGFRNGDRTRIVVQRADQETMTDGDLETLLDVKYVECMEPYGYVTDVSYAWREGVDYQYHYSVKNRGSAADPLLESVTSVELLSGMQFLRTVPVFADGREFITGGREPENMYEVVLAGDESRIGETIQVYLRDVKNWNLVSYVSLEVKVVGVTDYGSGLYFHKDMGRSFTSFMIGGGKQNFSYLMAPLYDSFVLLDDQAWFDYEQADGTWFARIPLQDGETFLVEVEGEPQTLDGTCLMEANQFATWNQSYKIQHDKYGEGEYKGFRLGLFNLNRYSGGRIDWSDMTDALWEQIKDSYDMAAVMGAHDSTYTRFVLVSPEDFDRIAWAGNSDQVSLFITDYAYTQRVLDALHALGYTAVSPFQQGSTEKDPELAAERMQTLTVCLAALAAVVLLQVLVLRELFGLQTESYKLLADMGLSCAAAKRSLLWQLLVLALSGQILGFLAIRGCGALGIDRIVTITRYLPPVYWLVLSAVHLAVSLLAGAMVMGTLARKVYPQSGESSDLELGSDEEAAL